MSRFHTLFPGVGLAVFPVVHAASQDQVLRNVEIAVEAWCHGVFLINHAVDSAELLRFHAAARERFPRTWIGVNCLDRLPTWVGPHHEVRGLWTDNARVDERKDEQKDAQRIWDELRAVSKWEGLHFGGVAFKGQRKVRPEHLAEAARKAIPFLDVVTTSGPGTGEAADVGKLRTMKEALGPHPLAVASGVTPDNILDHAPHVDAVLVASGISRDFENLEPDLVRRLVGEAASF